MLVRGVRNSRIVGSGTLVVVVALVLLAPPSARADAFSDYGLVGTFNLPATAKFDVLADGRLVTVVGTSLYAETGVGTRTFTALGPLAGASFPGGAFGGPAFVRVAPDGTRVAIGNNGGSSWSEYRVGVFNLADLTGTWFNVPHYDAAWIDNRHLALTAGAWGAPSVVTALDTLAPAPEPTNPVLVENIGGASAGIAFDAAGRLYTGNGFATGGPSDTGAIKAFGPAAWAAALSGGAPVNFETAGTFVADLLSASPLVFDAEGNLLVGGGDYLGGLDTDNAALLRHTALAAALAGGGPANPADPAQVRRFDPDSGNPSNFYDVNFNRVTGELYLREGAQVWVYQVPEPATAALLTAALLALRRGRRC